jgi:hypothetical protein
VGRFDREPPSLADVERRGAPCCHPAAALLIRGSKPNPEGFEQAPQINKVRDDEGAHIRAYPRAHHLEGAPHVVFKSRRGQLVGGSHRGRASAPSVPTEPHLANPCKRFHGRVPEPRANPYRTGHGRPLESPDSGSTRNSQFATRSMGVVETSLSVPRRDSEGAFKTSRRAHPDRLERAQARGLDTRLHLLWRTEHR